VKTHSLPAASARSKTCSCSAEAASASCCAYKNLYFGTRLRTSLHSSAWSPRCLYRFPPPSYPLSPLPPTRLQLHFPFFLARSLRRQLSAIRDLVSVSVFEKRKSRENFRGVTPCALARPPPNKLTGTQHFNNEYSRQQFTTDHQTEQNYICSSEVLQL
jgi:hypothetical protein